MTYADTKEQHDSTARKESWASGLKGMENWKQQMGWTIIVNRKSSLK